MNEIKFEVVKWLEGIIKEEVKSPSYIYTYIFNLYEDYHKDVIWAIVVGYDCEGNLCAKVGYQSRNSIMSEYDIDWLMPYYEDTGDVWDTEVSLDCTNLECANFIHTVDFLVNSFQAMLEALERNEINV